MQLHRNNIGVLRLVFASLVIIGHAPEMLDGDRTREPIHAMFGVLSLGMVSVDAFFLLSGYLIAKSMIDTASLQTYLTRRILRIYPAFIVAYLISVYALGPLVGAHPLSGGLHPWIRLAVLHAPPDFPGQLEGLHYPALNGALWSISLEFNCYMLIAALWCLGVLQRRWVMLAVTLGALILFVESSYHDGHVALVRLSQIRALNLLFGDADWLRMTSIFLCGTSIYLFRAEIFSRLTARIAAACAAISVVLIYHNPHFAEPALATFGALALFWLAFEGKLGSWQQINDRWDISYGVYLYGWPVATLIRYFDRGLSPWMLAAMTLPLAWACGAASWWGIERWSKDLLKSNRPARAKASPEPLPTTALSNA